MGLSSEMHSVYIERVCYFRYFLNLRRQPRTCGTAYPKPFRCPEPVRSIALLSQPAEQVADGGASCFFLTFGPFCRWHWMPVNLQLVRVLFSSRGEQSFWQRRADNFLSPWFSRSIASPKGEWPTRRLVCQWWDFVQLCNLAAQLKSHQNTTCRGDRAIVALHVTSSEALCV